MADVLMLDLSGVDSSTDYDLLYQDEEEEDNTEPIEEIDPLSDVFFPDDDMVPIKRILSHYTSENNEDRQICTRLVPDAVLTIGAMADFKMLVMVAGTLASDHYQMVRIGIVSVIPAILESNSQREVEENERELILENQRQLIEIPVKLLTDSEQEVRRVSQNVIVNLLAGDGDWKEVLLEKLFPVIKRCLGKDENYDLRMDAAMLISRMASLVKQDIFLKYFTPLLPILALDTMFHVRKAFALSCKELCPVLNEELAEEYILPLFLKLSMDEVWGVRKACADVFTDVSEACNLSTRYNQLTPAFLKLLHDDSRWVRKAAYQSLGAFISTFHVPNNGNQSYEEECHDRDCTLVPLRDHSLLDSVDEGMTTTDVSSKHRHFLHNGSEPMSNLNMPIHPPALYGSNSETANCGMDSKFCESPDLKSTNVEESGCSSKENGEERIKVKEDLNKSQCGRQCRSLEVCGRKNAVDVVSCDSADSACYEEGGCSRVVPSNCIGEESSEVETQELSTIKEVKSGSIEVEEKIKSCRSHRELNSPEREKIQSSAKIDPLAGMVDIISPPTLDFRIRSSSAGAAVRRISVDSGFNPHQRVNALSEVAEGKKRRWSLDRCNMYSNSLPQIRVFVHSTNGNVVEEDLTSTSPTKKEMESLSNPKPQSPVLDVVEEGESETAMHNYTTDNVSMDINLEVESEEEVRTSGEGDSNYLNQEMVPDELMEIYLSMTEHSRVQTVDSDLLYYCAYSLPGVTLTLGKTHWGLLKPTFSYLTEDLQWKIRRVLAFSLHELARVLGSEVTLRDILPVFEVYCTKDIDDVKIGTLTHLADFFELLPLDLREHHFPKVLDGLMQLENQKNWRYRNTLAEQLLQMTDFFDWIFLYDHVYPLAVLLSTDKVSEVRNSANLLIGALIKRISEKSLEKCHILLQGLRGSLSSNSSWLQRLMFVKQCETFLLNQHITHEMFASECLPSLLQLARDKVPNVRIAIAKLLKESVMSYEFFQSDRNGVFYLEGLQITLECLQHDADRDVKFFAGGEVAETPKLVVPPRQRYSQRKRSESHTSSDQDQYQDASEYLDLDVGSLTLSSSSPNMEQASKAGGSTGEFLAVIDDSDDEDPSDLAADKDHTLCHAHPSMSDEAVVADHAGCGSSEEAKPSICAGGQGFIEQVVD